MYDIKKLNWNFQLRDDYEIYITDCKIFEYSIERHKEGENWGNWTVCCDVYLWGEHLENTIYPSVPNYLTTIEDLKKNCEGHHLRLMENLLVKQTTNTDAWFENVKNEN